MKNIMKIAVLALALVMAVACFAGCGDKKAEEGTTVINNENSDKVYRIVSDNAFPPFESYDTETEKYVGIDMDIFDAIAKDQGFNYVMYNVGFKPALAQVQTGQADGVIAGMTITDERKETFDFSTEYFNDGQIMTVAADSDIDSMDDLKGKVVATKAGTMGLEYAEANAEKYGYTTMMFEGSVEMYQAVMQGTCVACFEDRAVIGEAINAGQALKTVGEVINPAPYGFGVKKGQNTELVEMFNKGLENIKANGTYDAILAKYGM